MKMPLERVITLSADTWAACSVIVLENLAFWKEKIRWSSQELREKKTRYLIWEEMDTERNQKWPFPGSLPFLQCAPLWQQRGTPLADPLDDIIGSQLNVCTENAAVTARLFLYWKSRNKVPALHQKRCDFLTKEECSVRRVFGTFPSAMKPGEWFEFLQNYLEFSCWEALLIVLALLSILHFVGGFPQVFWCSSVISQSWKVYYLFWQSPTYFVKQYTLLLQLTGVTLKILQFPFSLFERGFYICCLVYLPKGSTVHFLVNKSFILLLPFSNRLSSHWPKKKKKNFLWYSLNFDHVLKLVSSGSLKKKKKE